MPRGEGTGPMGLGWMTGRGAGFCAGFIVPGNANPIRVGCGFGGRRGFRMMCPAVDEKGLLSRQAEVLESRLQEVKKRLSSLKEDAE